MFSSVIETEAGVLQCGKQWFLQTSDFWWGIFSGTEQNRNGMEVAVMAYLTLIVFMTSFLLSLLYS